MSDTAHRLTDEKLEEMEKRQVQVKEGMNGNCTSIRYKK